MSENLPACRAHGCRPGNIFFAARGAGEKDGTFFRRAPCGARLPSSCSASGARSFQSTRPLRGATAVVRPAWPRYCHFNPRTPCGVRRDVDQCSFGFDIISIHAPLAGRDKDGAQQQGRQDISIHAPLAGRDLCAMALRAGASYFNPRAPCGVRPRSVPSTAAGRHFQSTHPLRGATQTGRRIAGMTQISIHAPLAGRDLEAGNTYYAPYRFQSTRPLRGATYAPPEVYQAADISIHAPLAGRDQASASSP